MNDNRWITAQILVAAFAVLVRLVLFLNAQAFWLDETLLALNVIETPLMDLLHPLERTQMAPFGFLAVTKLAVMLLGQSELVFRLFPFLCSLVSIGVLYLLTRECCNRKEQTIALFLFAISPTLINYAVELKQYAIDLCFALLLLWLWFYLRRRVWTGRSLFILALTGCVAILFSHASVFVLASLGVLCLLDFIRQKRWTLVSLMTGGAVLWLGWFYIMMIPNLGPRLNQSRMFTLFSNFYPPLVPDTLREIYWYLNFPQRILASLPGLTFAGLGVVLIVFAFIVYRKRQPWTLAALLLPLVFTFFAAALHKYPLNNRLLLFWTPSIIILMSLGIGAIDRLGRSKILAILCFGVVSFHPFVDALNTLLTPSDYPQVREALSSIRRQYQADDRLYVYYKAMPSMEYYGLRQGFTPEHLLEGVEARDNWSRYWQDIQRVRGYERVWFYFTHVFRWGDVDEERLYLMFLDQIGTRLKTHRWDGVSVYLYDLSIPERSDKSAQETDTVDNIE